MLPVLSGEDWSAVEKALPRYRLKCALDEGLCAFLVPAFITLILALLVGYAAGEGPFYMLDRSRVSVPRLWYSDFNVIDLALIFPGIIVPLHVRIQIYVLNKRRADGLIPELRTGIKFLFKDLHAYIQPNERLEVKGRGIRIFSTATAPGIRDVDVDTLSYRKCPYPIFAGIALFGALFLFYGAMSMGGVRTFQTLSKAGQLGLIITGGVILAIGLGIIARYAYVRSSAPPHNSPAFNPIVELIDQGEFITSFFSQSAWQNYNREKLLEYFHSENLKVCTFTAEQMQVLYQKMEGVSDAEYQEMMSALKNNISFDWKEAIEMAHKAKKLNLMIPVFQKYADDTNLIEAIEKLMQTPPVEDEEEAEQSLPGELKKICKALRLPYKEIIKKTLYGLDVEHSEALNQVFQSDLLDYLLPS